jgi:precorrin-4/cobalt-precorrin-4 C11-methyltransferase
MKTVYFVGAGPGDPELLTLRGKRLLEEADCIVYAGSLVNPKILDFARKEAVKIDSSHLSLEDIVDCIERFVREGKTVVRLHSGDPSIFGALTEQITALHRRGIAVTVVPGVSSVSAAAACLHREYTVPGVSQTLIITRCAGTTPVPEREKLSLLAEHRSSMAILLSAHLAGEVQRALLEAYPPETPTALVYHVTWPDEQILTGTLGELECLSEALHRRESTIILVGEFLKAEGKRSYLYRRKTP